MSRYLELEMQGEEPEESKGYTFDGDATVRISNPASENGVEQEPGPLSWFNSARITTDPGDDAIHYVLSLGDPRGGFCVTFRRLRDGRVIAHFPHPGEGMAHYPTRELHAGTLEVCSQNFVFSKGKPRFVDGCNHGAENYRGSLWGSFACNPPKWWDVWQTEDLLGDTAYCLRFGDGDAAYLSSYSAVSRDGQPSRLEENALATDRHDCKGENSVFPLLLELHATGTVQDRFVPADFSDPEPEWVETVNSLPRERCVELLESVGIACYDEEDVSELREAVDANIRDETIDPESLESE